MARRICRQCMARGFRDERIARGRVDEIVERDVGIDHRPDARTGGRLAPVRDHLRVDLGPGQRGLARGQAVQHRAHLVDVGDRPARRAARPSARGDPASITNPSFFSIRSACSTGCRDTSRDAASSSCVRRAPGARSPSQMAFEQALVDLLGQVGRELDAADGGHGFGSGDSVDCIQNTELRGRLSSLPS